MMVGHSTAIKCLKNKQNFCFRFQIPTLRMPWPTSEMTTVYTPVLWRWSIVATFNMLLFLYAQELFKIIISLFIVKEAI